MPADNLLENGDFNADLTAWTSSGSEWDGSQGGVMPGCAKIGTAAGTCNLHQNCDIDGDVGDQRRITIAFSVTASAVDGTDLKIYLLDQGGAVPTLWRGRVDSEKLAPGVWERIEHQVIATLPFLATVKFEMTGASGSDYFFVDDVLLTAEQVAQFAPQTYAGYVYELQVRRRDEMALKHREGRYYDVVYRAIEEYPRALWRNEIDTSLSTVAETRRYSLAALGGLTEPGQVRRIWMDDSSTAGHDNPLGRYEVEDDDGTLTLVLYEDPPEAGRTITIEYLRAPELPTSPDPNATITAHADREWVLARAMTLLLIEADPELEPVEISQGELAIWDTRLIQREQELRGRRRRPAGKLRTRKWSL